MSDLASALLTRLSGSGVKLWTGTVNATPSAQTVDVTVAGVLMTKLRWVSPYPPQGGEIVSLLQVGTDWIVLGKIGLGGVGEQAPSLSTATVTAIGANTLTVTVGIVSTAGIPWVTSYGPTVGDTVLLMEIGGLVVAIGKLSTSLGAITPPAPVPTVPTTQTVLLTPATQWDGKLGGSWSWSKDYPAYQGRGKEWYVLDAPPTYTRAAYFIFNPSVASQIPSGATVQSAKLRASRGILDGGASTPVSPVVYGHSRTAGSANPTGAPSFVSGFGPWKPGGLTPFQYATFDLPSTWLTALLAGTIAGFGLYSTSSADFGNFSLSLSITYST